MALSDDEDEEVDVDVVDGAGDELPDDSDDEDEPEDDEPDELDDDVSELELAAVFEDEPLRLSVL